MADEDLTIRASLDDDLSRPIRRVRDELKETVQAAEKLNRTVGFGGPAFRTLDRQLNAAGRAAKGTGSSMRGATRQADGFRKALTNLDRGAVSASRSLNRGLRLAAIGAGAALGAAGAAATTFGLKAAAGFEQSTIAFQALTGSVERGNRLFAELRELNKRSPFELTHITTATQTLLQYGFTADNVLETLTNIGDVSALSSNPVENLNRIAVALGQIRAAGVLRAQDLNQLVQAGFPAYELLADLTGDTMQQIRKDMESGLDLPADEFVAALNRMQGPLARYAGGMQKQALTLSGMWSTFKDTVNEQLAGVGAPLAEEIKKLMPELTRLVGSLLSTIGPPLARVLLALIPIAESLVEALAPVLATFASIAAEVLRALGPSFAELARMGPELASAFTDLATALTPLVPVIGDLLVAMGPLLVTFLELTTALLNGFLPLVTPLLQWLADSTSSSKGFRTVLAALLMTLLGYRALRGVAGAVGSFAGALRGVGAAGRTAAVGADAGAAAVGRFARAQRAAAGAMGGAALGGGLAPLVPGYDKMSDKNKGKFSRDMSVAGGMIGTGASFGGLPGAVVGTGAAVLYTGGRLLQEVFGDTASPHRLGRTVATHASIDSQVPGKRSITSGYRTWGVGADSDHKAGAALDITGANLGAYASALRAAGGWASIHDSGTGRHLHGVYGDTSSPRRGALGDGGTGPGDGVPPVQVNVYYPSRELDVERAVSRGMAKAERDRIERARRERVR